MQRGTEVYIPWVRTSRSFPVLSVRRVLFPSLGSRPVSCYCTVLHICCVRNPFWYLGLRFRIGGVLPGRISRLPSRISAVLTAGSGVCRRGSSRCSEGLWGFQGLSDLQSYILVEGFRIGDRVGRLWGIQADWGTLGN